MSLKQRVRTNISETYIEINEFEKEYQPSTNIANDENGYLLADDHSILNRWQIGIATTKNLRAD
jgi:hypothetical protein